jgi:tetratricopeptide (TPR) repeat protein
LAAKAIYALGRVEALQQSQTATSALGAPRSLALFHAALTIDPHNTAAANELAVMLASRGRLPEAAALLERSVAVTPTPVAVENLVTVYEQLGDPRASQWRQHAQQLAGQAYGSARVTPQPIVWLDPQTFGGVDSEVSMAWPPQVAAHERPSSHQEAVARATSPTPAVAPIGVSAAALTDTRATYAAPQTAPERNTRRWW